MFGRILKKKLFRPNRKNTQTFGFKVQITLYFILIFLLILTYFCQAFFLITFKDNKLSSTYRVKFLGVLSSGESWSPHSSKLDKILLLCHNFWLVWLLMVKLTKLWLQITYIIWLRTIIKIITLKNILYVLYYAKFIFFELQ